MSRYRTAADLRAIGSIDLPQMPGWFRDAACFRVGHDLFFGPPSDAPEEERETPEEKEEREARAKALCAGCPVRPECREYDRSFQEPIQRSGVWHGDNFHERKIDYRRDLRRAAAKRQQKGQTS
ncbi:WhiB family transcriptional regulator [Nonomuraea angiospora]|uniref:WhiB family transcriptional regulator n=1 Tax=Nonomuraea angiospora TaxID=46172 RepID=UPI003450553A